MTKAERRDHARRLLREAAQDPAWEGMSLFYRGDGDRLVTVTVAKSFYDATWHGSVTVGGGDRPLTRSFDRAGGSVEAIERMFVELWGDPSAEGAKE